MGKVGSEEIREALVHFIGRHLSICFIAKVTDNSKAEEEGIIEVEFNELKYEVKLQALSEATDKGELKIPAEGSEVFCVSEGNSDSTFVVVATTELEKYQQRFGGITIEVNDKKIVFNGGNLGGLVIIQKLIDNLNMLKEHVETMQAAIGPAFKSVGVSLSANGPTGAQSFDSAMAGMTIEFQDMEDKKVLH